MARPSGLLNFRFVLQPLLAVIIAIRAGIRDTRTLGSPYLSGLLFKPAKRRQLVHSMLNDIGRLFILAVVLDCCYQLLEFRWIYPMQALIIGCVLAIVPYILIRGPVNRLANRWITRRN